jgi:hypothetical protein
VDRSSLDGHRPFSFESAGILRIQHRRNGTGTGQEKGPETESFDRERSTVKLRAGRRQPGNGTQPWRASIPR